MEPAPLPTTLAAVAARQSMVDADLISARERLRLARRSSGNAMIAAALRRGRRPWRWRRRHRPSRCPTRRRRPRRRCRRRRPRRRRAAAPPPSPPPDDDASDACASPPAAHRWRRYYDAETRAHYWYDARTQVVSWSDPERPPRDPAHARRPTAASLARSLPGSPQRLRFHCCAVESADSEPEEEPKPQRRRRPAPGYLKARRTPRRGAYEKGQFSTLRR